jgi:hypothetical protein
MSISYPLRSSSSHRPRSSSMGTSPRMAPLCSTLRGNVLFVACSLDDSLRLSYRGPGTYFSTDQETATSLASSSLSSPLRRRSFNVRAQNGNAFRPPPASPHNSTDQHRDLHRHTDNHQRHSSSERRGELPRKQFPLPSSQGQRQREPQQVLHSPIKTGGGGGWFSRSVTSTPINRSFERRALFHDEEEEEAATPRSNRELHSGRYTPYQRFLKPSPGRSEREPPSAERPPSQTRRR